jgi:hypothetical protein
MSWLDNRTNRNQGGLEDLANAIKKANSGNIIMLCTSSAYHATDRDTSSHNPGHYDASYYDVGYNNATSSLNYLAGMKEVFSIGAVIAGKGLESFENRDVDFTFPGDKVLAELVSGLNVSGVSIATALATGVVALLLYCQKALHLPGDLSSQVGMRRALRNYARNWKSLQQNERDYYDSAEEIERLRDKMQNLGRI